MSEDWLRERLKENGFVEQPDGDWERPSPPAFNLTPKVVYVSSRTFWDWLAELEWPKRKTLYKTLGCILCVLALVGTIFFMAWFQYFGAMWAKAPVGIVGFASAFGCVVGFVAIISDGFK